MDYKRLIKSINKKKYLFAIVQHNPQKTLNEYKEYRNRLSYKQNQNSILWLGKNSHHSKHLSDIIIQISKTRKNKQDIQASQNTENDLLNDTFLLANESNKNFT